MNGKFMIVKSPSSGCWYVYWVQPGSGGGVLNATVVATFQAWERALHRALSLAGLG